jgi:hypothetical protein
MSTTPLPDNRIRLQAPPIDFEDDVGNTGQDHDDYPDPGQARYDWMRMYLIGLLANQASFNEPVNYRKGTPWFDLNTMTLKIRTGEGVAGTTWSDFSDVIQVSTGLTLKDWFDAVAGTLAERLVSEEELVAALGHYFTADVSGNIESFIMAAPNGNRYRVTVNNTGNLITTLIT